MQKCRQDTFCGTTFLNYLKQLNCRDVEFSDLITDEQIENGTTTDYDVLHAQQIIDGYKQQLKEFMRIGGDPQYVKNLDRLDLYIEIVKRLKEYGWLDNQQKYIEYAEDTDALDLDWELSQISHQINNAVAYEDINSLSGVEFENVCQALVEKMGFTTQTTKASGDGGIDLIAYNSQPLLSGKYIIQCKRYTGSVGEPIIRDLYGVITSERANKGILMTTGHFTKSAISFAEGKPIELIDCIKLKELLTQYQLVLASQPTVDLVEFLEQLNDENISIDDETDSLTVLNQFCGFSTLNDMLLQNTYNYSVRARIIDLLMQAYLWDNREYFIYDEVYYEKIPITAENYKRCLAQSLREAIVWFYKFADEKDAKVQIVKDFYCVYLAEIELVAGNLYNAYRLFDIALKSKMLHTENDTISMIVTNMCQILASLGLKDELKVLMAEYAPLLQHLRNITDDVYQNNPNNPYAKLDRNLYLNMHTPMAFIIHNYAEYLETGKISDNLYDQCVFNGTLNDSIFTTYLETQKVTISNDVMRIFAVTNPKYPHTTLDYLKIMECNKTELQKYLGKV